MNSGWAIAVMGIAAAAADGGTRPRETATVCMDTPTLLLAQAQVVASLIFARIGVTIRWVKYENCPPEAILVNLRNPAGMTAAPGVMAYSLPYERTSVYVLYDRIVSRGEELEPWLLAHILAHEITHMLQGISRHSEEGMMKTAWDSGDYLTMSRGHTLPFTRFDQDLVHAGIRLRMARLAARASVP